MHTQTYTAAETELRATLIAALQQAGHYAGEVYNGSVIAVRGNAQRMCILCVHTCDDEGGIVVTLRGVNDDFTRDALWEYCDSGDSATTVHALCDILEEAW